LYIKNPPEMEYFFIHKMKVKSKKEKNVISRTHLTWKTKLLIFIPCLYDIPYCISVTVETLSSTPVIA
jgi:hypothetical protein